MKVAFGNDHAAVDIKAEIIAFMENELQLEVVNMGTDEPDSVDYPDFARLVAEQVASGKTELGVVICGTGIGISIAANKVDSIRCGLCCTPEMAEMTRKHNNANVLAMGARVTPVAEMKKILTAFFHTDFEGGRHQNRIQKITDLEGLNS